jgi:hypothetical protein
VNDASGNITVGNNITVTGTFTGSTGVMNIGSGQLYKDSSGNVGIGTSSPGYKLDVNGSIRMPNATVFWMNNSSGVAKETLNLYSDNNTYFSTPGALIMRTNGVTEAARIDSSGNFLVGLTSPLAGAKASFYQNNASTSWSGFFQAQNTFGCIGTTNVSGTASYTALGFYNNGTTFSSCGAISVSGTTTTYATSSDYRLKKSIAPMTSGLATVSALKPITYKWNADDSDGEGFIAHELQEVIPHAVVGEKDAVDENGKIKPQGVDYSKIVVHLVAAIQEQQATITALTARVAALEAK